MTFLTQPLGLSIFDPNLDWNNPALATDIQLIVENNIYWMFRLHLYTSQGHYLIPNILSGLW